MKLFFKPLLIAALCAAAAAAWADVNVGVTVEPRMTSTLCSLISLRVLLTAAVVSLASSSTM